MAFAIDLKTGVCRLERTENVERFFHDIRAYKPLSEEEETRLFKVFREGTEKEAMMAKEQIILHNLHFLVSVAKKYSTKDTLLDHINECSETLIECIDKFDPDRGNKFVTMAVYHLRCKMNSYRTQTESMVRQTNRTKTFHCISKVRNQLTQELERNPSDDEVLERINRDYGKGINDTADIIDIQYSPIDLSDSYTESEAEYSNNLEYNEASASINNYVKFSDIDYNKKVVSGMLSCLSSREQLLIKMKFGLMDDEFAKEYNNQEIAEAIGLTPERVRQMEKEAIAKMKAKFHDVLKRHV